MFVSIMMKKWLLLKNIPILRLDCKNDILFITKTGQIYPIHDQNSWKTIPFGAAHTYIAHIKEYPPSRGVQALARFIVLCSWARQFFLGLPLSTQVYKWVLANLTLGVGGGILLASHFSLCSKKWVYSLAWWASRLECRLYLPFLSNTTVLARYKK